MDKSINTLITDIYKLVQSKTGWLTNELANSFAAEIASKVQSRFEERNNKGTLRLSKMGVQCPRALWYSVHHPELAEKPNGPAEIKFTYGDLIEAQLLMFCKASGHEVVGEQDAVYVDGILGHRDCIIDGCLVDIKSANSRAFQKYQLGNTEDIDAFGVLSQLDGYMVGSMDDPLLRVKDRAYILAVDKELGKLHLHEHKLRERLIRDRVADSKRIVGRDTPPDCSCGTSDEGGSGNIRLDFKASYNPFKYQCHPNLRTFIYKGKAPGYFTKVVKVPSYQGIPLMEVDKEGNKVYN